MSALSCDIWPTVDLCTDCKSGTVSPEIDFGHLFTTQWRTTCFGKCRCRARRVKSLGDLGSFAQILGSIIPTCSARLGTCGAAMATPLAGDLSRYAKAPAALRLPTALTAKTTQESSISAQAFAIRLPTAFCHLLVSKYRSPVTPMLGARTLFLAGMDATGRGFQRLIVGQSEISNASRRRREPLPLLRVLLPGSHQVGLAA